jgi:glycosyl hydrolase family 1
VAALEYWASPEPTVARVGADAYRDQLAETGHEARDGDGDLIASLGVRATRVPVLWEKCAPHDPRSLDLAWPRRRLLRLRELGVEQIVTLLHHGSGPRYTSLVDPAFPHLLAAYAGAVAAAFPWVRRWTPINEPLTTARFATLYGHWYPNAREDHRAFGAAIVNEALGTVLAMHAIRRSVPDAELVLTEDLQGFTALDAGVADYVAHKRERAFLSAELVMGRVIPGHALYDYLCTTCCVAPELLRELAAGAIAPALMGWNYYPYSERTLWSGVDGAASNMATVEVGPLPISPRPLLRAAHARLGLPFALAEVHVHGTAEERVRWLLARDADLRALAAEGLPAVALGAWAAFGLVDWDSLLVRSAGRSEDGIFTFDAADAEPQPTAVAETLRALARGERLMAPAALGWWESERRLPRHFSRHSAAAPGTRRVAE